MPKAKKLPSGSYRVRVYLGKKDGKPIIKSFTAPTKKQAEYNAAVYLMQQRHRENVGLTLENAFTKYIESKNDILSPATIRDYENIKNKKFPELMPLPLSSLTNELIQISFNEYSRTLSPTTLYSLYVHLAAVLKAYYPEFKLSVTLPPKKKKEKRLLTEKDVEKLIAAAAGSEIEVPIMLAAFGSLRRGEVAALTPADVTDDGVYVRHTIVNDANGQPVRKSPKTPESYRFVPLPEWIIKKLKKWSFDISIYKIDYEFSKITKTVGFENVTFHTLRHFFAAECHALGIPDKYIMRVGGWSSVATLQKIYQYAMPDKQIEFSNMTLKHFNAFNPDK